MPSTELYREHLPSPALRPYVSCFWTSEAERPASKRVLPDGCVDILFDAASTRGPYVVGTMTEALVVERKGPERIAAVRFRPSGARPFLGVPMSELRDLQVSLEELIAVDQDLEEAFVESRSPRESLSALDRSLSRRLDGIASPDTYVSHAVDLIERSDGRASVQRVCEVLGLSRQHLNRLFVREVGVGTKFFSRVVRFQSAMARARRCGGGGETARGSARESWASLAIDAGYFDQAHFIDECRALSGLTPTRLLASR